jgi:hypothetical protein
MQISTGKNPISQSIKIRVFQIGDYKRALELISDIIVNEFKFKLEFDTLGSDIFAIEKLITNLIEVAFGLQKALMIMMIIPALNKNSNKK